jgi:hypothetical protein
MNFMLNPYYEKSTWYQSIGLEEPIAQEATSLLSLLQNRMTLLGFPKNSYDLPLRGISALKHLNVGDIFGIGEYGLPQRISRDSQSDISRILKHWP